MDALVTVADVEPPHDDSDVVARARDGDLGAFDQLVERHSAAAYRVALRMLGDPGDAQDAVQDAFVEVWRSLGSFRGDSAFTTWLYRIVVNRCLRVLRRRRPSEPLPEIVVSTAPGPERAAVARSQVAHLLGALDRLTPEQRAVFVLRELEGLTYEQIGLALGVTVAAVKSRLHRARIEVLQAMRAWT